MAVAYTEERAKLSKLCELQRSINEFRGESARYPWFALQVRTRHEIGVADYLSGKGYEWFLPLHRCRKRWSDRVREVESALFPGYLFCRFNPENRLPILQTPGVIQIVGFNPTPIPVSDDEIRAVQKLMASGIPNQPWPFLRVGDQVRIESGPLTGLEGILTEFKGRHRLVISITLLQRSVAAEIDSAFVKSLRPAKTGKLENGSSSIRTAEALV
jgi:transcription antitermination factor NusG